MISAWYCTHHESIYVGDRKAGAEVYCRANRMCEVGPEGCHSIVVSGEFLESYNGPVYGSLLALRGAPLPPAAPYGFDDVGEGE